MSQQAQRYTLDEPREEERPRLKSRRELREEAAHGKGRPAPRNQQETAAPRRPRPPVELPESAVPYRTAAQQDFAARQNAAQPPMARQNAAPQNATQPPMARQNAVPQNAAQQNAGGREETAFKGGNNRGGRSGQNARGGRDGQLPRGGLITAIVVGCIALFAAVVAALGLNVFVVKHVSIQGGINYTQAEMMEAMHLRMGQSMFTVSGMAMENALADKPTLILEKVERRFPDTVVLTLRETTPTLVVAYLNQYALLDNELRVLSLAASLPTGDYPLVTGMVVLDAQQGERVVSNDKTQLAALDRIVAIFGSRSEIADETTYAPLHYMSEIKLQNVREINMYTADGFTIELGDAENLERKALWVEQMLPVFKQKGYAGGVLDVTASSAATFIPAAGKAEQVLNPPPTVPQALPEGENAPQEGGEDVPQEGWIPIATAAPGAQEPSATPAGQE